MEAIDVKLDAFKWLFSNDINDTSLSSVSPDTPNAVQTEEKLKVDRKKFEALLNGNGLYSTAFTSSTSFSIRFSFNYRFKHWKR